MKLSEFYIRSLCTEKAAGSAVGSHRLRMLPFIPKAEFGCVALLQNGLYVWYGGGHLWFKLGENSALGTYMNQVIGVTWFKHSLTFRSDV